MPSITGFEASAPRSPSPEDRGAVGDDGDEIALGGIVIGGIGILGDLAHRNGDARAIGERQVALGRHRLGRVDLELARLAALMELQRLLVGEGRALGRLLSIAFNPNICTVT